MKSTGYHISVKYAGFHVIHTKDHLPGMVNLCFVVLYFQSKSIRHDGSMKTKVLFVNYTICNEIYSGDRCDGRNDIKCIK